VGDSSLAVNAEAIQMASRTEYTENILQLMNFVMILLSQTLKRQALTNAAQSSFKTIVIIYSKIEIATL